MIIISETRRGEAYPYSACSVVSEQVFIDKVRNFQLSRMNCNPYESIQSMVSTKESAIEWMNNAFAQLAEVITKDNYIIGHSSKVDELANELGWNDDPNIT